MKQNPFIMLPKKIFGYKLPSISFADYCYLCCCDNKQNGCHLSPRTISFLRGFCQWVKL